MLTCIRKKACLCPLRVPLTACCSLILSDGTKLPDSGALSSASVRKDTPFYLDVAAEGVEEKGMCADAPASAMKKRLLTVDGMKDVDQPGPGTLAARADVRERYLTGMTRKSCLKSAGAALAFATVGSVGGARETGLFQKEIRAVRAGVGMAWAEKPTKPEELVVSVGARAPAPAGRPQATLKTDWRNASGMPSRRRRNDRPQARTL